MAVGPGEIAAGVAAVIAVMAALAWIGRRTWQARALPTAGAESAARSAAPPDVTLVWAAEIEWHHDPGGDPRFWIVASSPAATERATVGESEPLGWPPTGQDSIEALKRAVEQLESGAVAAGWTPAPAGQAWYARRFTWHPGGSPERLTRGQDVSAAPRATRRGSRPRGRSRRRRS